MIQFDQKALSDCIKNAIREELQIFISGIQNKVDDTVSKSSEKLLKKEKWRMNLIFHSSA